MCLESLLPALFFWTFLLLSFFLPVVDDDFFGGGGGENFGENHEIYQESRGGSLQ